MRRRQLFLLPISFFLVLVLSSSSSALPVKNAKPDAKTLEAALFHPGPKKLEAGLSQPAPKKLEVALVALSQPELKKLEAVHPKPEPKKFEAAQSIPKPKKLLAAWSEAEPKKLEAALSVPEPKKLEAALSEPEPKKLEAALSEPGPKKLEAAPPPKNGKPKDKDAAPPPPEKKPPPKANQKVEKDKPKDAPSPPKNPPPKDAPPGDKPKPEKKSPPPGDKTKPEIKSPSPGDKPKDQPLPGNPKPNEPPPPPPPPEEPRARPEISDVVGQAEATVTAADASGNEVTAGKSPQDMKRSSTNVLPIALGVTISLAVLSLLCLFCCILPRFRNRSSKMRHDGDEAALASSLFNFTAGMSPAATEGLVKRIESTSDFRFSMASALGGGARGGYVMDKPPQSNGLFDSSLYPDPPILPPVMAASSESSFGRRFLDADDDSYLPQKSGSYKSASLMYGAGGEIE